MSLYPNYFIDNGVGVTNVSGDKKVGIGIDGVSFQKDILTTPITTILDGDGFDFAGEIVSWDNIYNLKQATPALRLPATANAFVLDDTLECNDNNLAKTRTAVLNASPLIEPSLTLTNITSGATTSVSTPLLSILDPVNACSLKLEPLTGLELFSAVFPNPYNSYAGLANTGLTLLDNVSGDNSVLTSQTLTLNDIANSYSLSLTPDSGLQIDNLPLPSSKNIKLDVNNGLVITNFTFGDNTATLTASNLTLVEQVSGSNCNLSPTSLSVNEPNNGINATYNSSGITANDIYTISSPANISLNGTGFVVNASDFITLTANNDAIDISADDNISLTSNSLGDINLDAPNINSYGYALPICFNQFEEGNWSYTSNGQAFQDVFSASVPLPVQFFALNPQSGYTSSRWELNFDMNCWNFANAGDKGFAIYLSFLDNNGNLYEPFLYNKLTPFCKWDNPPQFNGAFSQFKSINFCDRIDLGGLQGSNDSNLQLQMNIAGDNVFINVDFKFKLGFTRINPI